MEIELIWVDYYIQGELRVNRCYANWLNGFFFLLVNSECIVCHQIKINRKNLILLLYLSHTACWSFGSKSSHWWTLYKRQIWRTLLIEAFFVKLIIFGMCSEESSIRTKFSSCLKMKMLFINGLRNRMLFVRKAHSKISILTTLLCRSF